MKKPTQTETRAAINKLVKAIVVVDQTPRAVVLLFHKVTLKPSEYKTLLQLAGRKGLDKD